MASLLDALIQVESAGIPGRPGPRTQYGQAMGLTQMLPNTAQEMARKLGVEWRPDLLSSPTDEGAQYQRQLGQAYLSEGMERTGNTRDALRYYHGGPNRNLWGPKTNAYADKVLSLSGDEQPMMPPNNVPVDIQQGPLTPNASPLASLMGETPQFQEPKAGAFGQGGKGWVIAGIIADAIAGGFGGKGGFAPAYTAMQEDDRQMDAWREKIAADREERLQPKLMQANGAILSVDPRNNQVTPVYQSPDDGPEATSLERNIAFLRQLNPDLSDADIAALVRQNISQPQFPRIVSYNQGDQSVTEEIGPDGQRTIKGRAPRWQPKPQSEAKLPSGFILDN